MTITNGNISSEGEFLAQAGASPGNSQSLDERFLSALQKSLSDAGFGRADVEIERMKAAGVDTQDAVIRLTLATAEARIAAAESRTGKTTMASVESEVPAIKGPQITRDMWTEELLTGDLTAETLAHVQDPAELLNARLAAVRKPTEAAINDSTTGASQRINSSILATREQAEAMLERLTTLGLSGGAIEERLVMGGPYALEYNGDERRCYNIDGMSVGMLVERYAKYPVEVADEMTLAELSKATAA